MPPLHKKCLLFIVQGPVSGWPFSANMQLRTFAVSDELAFRALWIGLAGLKVISPAFNSKGWPPSGSNTSAPDRRRSPHVSSGLVCEVATCQRKSASPR